MGRPHRLFQKIIEQGGVFMYGGIWQVQRTNPEYVEYLSRTASIAPALAQVFINRGLKSCEEIDAFVNQSVEGMSDPYAMSGVERAVELLAQASEEGKTVLVHGDYDADGVTATSIILGALRGIGIDARFFIPTRFEHGYGFNPPAVDLAEKMGAGLILTVDCGVSAFDAVGLARSRGIAVIITDHHEPMVDDGGGNVLPEADAIINPKLCSPDISMLSGAGVAFKLIQALSIKFPRAFEPLDFLDLAALGTLADSVPLTGENRAIVREGMPLVAEGKRPGIAALKTVAGINGRPLRAGRVLFTIIPRINAAGRIDDASRVVDLMLSDDEESAMLIAEDLNRMNLERQQIEEGVFKEALDMVEEGEPVSALVLCGTGWHEGVLGIVASRIAERFKRPAFVLAETDGEVRGSARSIPQFDIYEGLKRCAGCLKTYGGHRQAAGLSLGAGKVEEFRSRICAIVDEGVEDYSPVLMLDASLALRDVNFKLVEELSSLEPFGYGNPEPIFGTRELQVVNSRVVGRNHLKVTLKSQNITVDSIGYGMGHRLDELQDTYAIDVAFAATINEWGNRRSIQLNLKSFRPTT